MRFIREGYMSLIFPQNTDSCLKDNYIVYAQFVSISFPIAVLKYSDKGDLGRGHLNLPFKVQSIAVRWPMQQEPGQPGHTASIVCKQRMNASQCSAHFLHFFIV